MIDILLRLAQKGNHNVSYVHYDWATTLSLLVLGRCSSALASVFHHHALQSVAPLSHTPMLALQMLTKTCLSFCKTVFTPCVFSGNSLHWPYPLQERTRGLHCQDNCQCHTLLGYITSLSLLTPMYSPPSTCPKHFCSPGQFRRISHSAATPTPLHCCLSLLTPHMHAVNTVRALKI